MVNSKRKGGDWERDLVKLLNKYVIDGEFKRIAGSGSFGHTMNEPSLLGDIKGKILGFNKNFRLEAKVGYGGSKQLTVQKEWIDKIIKEADATFSIPAVACKFSNARKGVQYFFILDFNTFVQFLNLMSDKEILIERLTKRLEEYEKNGD